jgi:ABC-2 type transport system permease protein
MLNRRIPMVVGIRMVAKRHGATHIKDMTVEAPAATHPSVSPALRVRPLLEPRRYAGVNWEGLKTLYLKEVRRFWKVGMQTVFAPVITTLLYMMVFVVAMRGTRPTAAASFGEFVGPGLIMMSILNNAFANSSSSLLQAKIMGTAPDFLTPPLSAFELTAGFGLGAATRGLFVGIVTAAAVWPFSHYHMAHLWAALYFALVGSLLLGLVGMLAGIWAEKFDHLASVTNFVVMPLTFLSGTFYSVDRLPEPFRSISHYNPLFYLIDGFRYAFLGTSAGNVTIGVVVGGALVVALAGLNWALFNKGWRLKT